MRAACISCLVVCVLLARPSFGQTTRPSDELAKENAELKKRIEKLEAYVAELEAKVRRARKPTIVTPAPRVIPRLPAPYGYELPAPPFKLPSPPIVPAPRLPEIEPAPEAPNNTLPPRPRQSAPDTWKRHEFNGQEFYLVPLE